MDTKSKNSRYSLLALIAFVLSVSLSLLTAADLYHNREYLQKDNYFQSSGFRWEMRDFAELVKTVHVDYAGYEEKTLEEKLGKETLEQLKPQWEEALQEAEDNISQEYAPRIEVARKAGQTEEVARLTAEQENRRKAALDKEAAAQRKQVNEIVANKDRDYEERKTSLALRNGSFHYYVTDKKTNKVYTNMDHEPTEAEINQNARFSITFPQNTYTKFGEYTDINRTFQLNQLHGVFYVPVNSKGYSQIEADAVYYDSIRDRLLKECALLTITLFISALLAWYGSMMKTAQHPIVMKCSAMFRRIPLDIRIALLFPVGITYLLMISNMRFFFLPIDIEHFFTLAMVSVFTAYLLLQLLDGWHMYKQPESFQEQWQRSLLFRQRVLFKESFANKGVFFKVATLFILTIGLGMSVALAFVALIESIGELLVLCFLYGMFYMVVVFPYVLRRIGLMNRILLGASEMASGNMNASIEKIRKGKLSELAHSLNNIRQGLKHAMEDQMKSERLKSELITNVSHDLKTPLTSIVNYVDLLKRENLSADEIKSYVDVLERKTERLRILIDDLFDAAKMASGSVELNIEEVNVAALLNQSIAEFSDKIEQSSLTFRVNTEQAKIYAPLDGKKTWRVFENLIGNALKYSMPNTRVLIDLFERQDQVILTIKNVSAYEINFDAEELFERFKRADQSRNTEGSGLGLAIAKSIVELQGGKLSIEIDGDYFKVTVVFHKS
ncbi:histidine kinase dimerization/phospho-acceptor domain-containing protein [Brevibacillus sp. NRS-1366]|uniref:histidine kinase dimerization/phospho-acceptor domain-containing protein n=1 Tax=Brevibacillus sp. NRS-1366 TaxID=3233899 RepID=UPI003D1A52CF